MRGEKENGWGPSLSTLGRQKEPEPLTLSNHLWLLLDWSSPCFLVWSLNRNSASFLPSSCWHFWLIDSNSVRGWAEEMKEDANQIAKFYYLLTALEKGTVVRMLGNGLAILIKKCYYIKDSCNWCVYYYSPNETKELAAFIFYCLEFKLWNSRYQTVF